MTASERSHVIHSRLEKYLSALEKYTKRRLLSRGVSDLNAQRRDLDRLLNVFVEESADGPRVMVAFPRNDPPELLYTITPADVARVRLDSSEPTAIALRAAQVAKSALLRGWEELQPPFRRAALRRALITLLLIGGISALVLFGQTRLRRHHTILLTRLQGTSGGGPDSSEPGRGFRKVPLLKRVNLRHQISLISFYRSSLYWGQWLLWAAGVGYIAGLFPQTRPFRNWLIGVSVRGYLGGNDPVPVGWAPLDWMFTLGREATIGLPVLILLLVLMTRISIRAGNLLCDLYVKEWMQSQEGDRNQLRAPTLARALKGWIAVGVYLILGMVVIYQLHRLGAVTQAVAVFLGFLSFALSLASQNLLKDLIGGFLILLEDQYAAGDVVIIGDQAGLVEQVGLRVTQLRNLDGELITIPNGVVSTVRNLSSNWSRVNYAIQVDVAEDADRVMDIMNAEAQALAEDPDWRDRILEAPEILGIDEITHQGMLIRMLIRTRPLEQWSVGREYRRRLKKALDAAGIAVGVPHLEVQGLEPPR
ncbi:MULTISPECIES: mechanosensitive ion channel family protein [Aphanothece]|uniref:mechanosensitive ion channel family protein n=1 Tax=Aphanothece TaxID=1121 RepID=UPI00398F0B02